MTTKILFCTAATLLLNGIAYFYGVPTVDKSQMGPVNGALVVLTASVCMEYLLSVWALRWNNFILLVVQGLWQSVNIMGLILLSLVTGVFVFGGLYRVPLLLYLFNAWWISAQANSNQVKAAKQQQSHKIYDDVLDNNTKN